MQQRSKPAVLWALLILLHATTALGSQAQISPQDVFCPFHYPRHSLEQFNDSAVRPYLFGGIYNSDRDCVNCKRGGLWSDFCSFKVTKKMEDVPFWSNQLCSSSSIVDAAIKRTMQMDDAEDILSMTPCDLWYFLRGRTTWIVGDSMSKDLFKALKCFMVEFTDLKTYHASTNYTAMHYLDSLPGFGEPHCMHMPHHTRLCQVHAIQGDLFIEGNRTKIGVIPLLQESLAASHDIFIVNFGLWHGETQQVQYKEHLHQLGKFYNKTRLKFPNLFWMETPKQHFDSADGDYKVAWIGKRKGPFVCQPVQNVTFKSDGYLTAADGDAIADYVIKGSWRNIFAREILRDQYDVPMFPIYNVTATAWDFHRVNFDGQECSHFCHPSIPQLWVYMFKQTLEKYRVPPVTDSQVRELNKRRKPGCASVFEREEGKLGAPKPLHLALQQQRSLQGKAGKVHSGLWGGVLRLFGSRSASASQLSRLEIVDGVAMLRKDSRDLERGVYSHSETLRPWEGLQRLLQRHQEQQQRHYRQRKQHGSRDKERFI